MRNPPELRKHATGQFFVRWGGRDHYFGHDRQAAQERYLTDPTHGLPAWTQWRLDRDASRLPPLRAAITCKELAEQFMAAKHAERGGRIRSYYTVHLKLFLAANGTRRADTIKPMDIQKVQTDMVSARLWKPKTINHTVIAVKALFNWAADMELVPPMRLRAIKCLPVGEPRDRSLSLDTIRAAISRAQAADKSVAAWLAVNYLTLARPIEVVRVVNGWGEWEQEGVFRLAESKTEYKTGLARRLVFSHEALHWLADCVPRWARRDGYQHVAREWLQHPGVLRHSGATHLIHQHGVPRGYVEALLGHVAATRRESVRYARTEWPLLREKAALLTLKPLVASSVKPSKKKHRA